MIKKSLIFIFLVLCVLISVCVFFTHGVSVPDNQDNFECISFKGLPDLEGIRILNSIHYDTNYYQSLDMYVPENNTHYPVVIFVHGGNWSGEDKSTFCHIGSYLARNKIGCVCVNYRLSPEVQHPVHTQDVAKAIKWVYECIPCYGGDRKNIFLMGHSAGANIVSLLVTNDKYLKETGLNTPNIKGVVAISGVYRINPIVAFYGTKEVFPNKESRKDASPILFVKPKLPPFFIVYGDKDILTLAKQAQDFHKALIDHKCQSELLALDNHTHLDTIINLVKPDSDYGKKIINFINAHANLHNH